MPEVLNDVAPQTECAGDRHSLQLVIEHYRNRLWETEAELEQARSAQMLTMVALWLFGIACGVAVAWWLA